MSDGWSNDRREVTYQEARAVLEQQQQTIADIDDKALRTVRITVVLVGIIITGIQTDLITNVHNGAFTAGAAFLFISLLAGMTTYSESDLYTGPNRRYIRKLADGQFVDTAWDEDYLMKMAYWVSENKRDVAWNGTLLLLTQGALLAGVFLVSLAVGF